MKEKIYQIIKERSPIKRKDLLPILQYTYPELIDRKMRKIIEIMIKKGGYSIRSSKQGYSTINSWFDLEGAMDYLRKPAIASFERAKMLHRNYTKNKGAQLSLTDFMKEKQ